MLRTSPRTVRSPGALAWGQGAAAGDLPADGHPPAEAHNYSLALWWAERGIARYGSDCARPEAVENLCGPSRQIPGQARRPARGLTRNSGGSQPREPTRADLPRPLLPLPEGWRWQQLPSQTS